MNPNPIVVSPSLDLLQWLDDFVYRYHHRAFPVVANGRLEGVITTQMLGQIPRDERAVRTVCQVMDVDLGTATIGADADALEALSKMQQTGASRLLVTDGSRLVGIVSLRDLLRFLNLKLEFERDDGDRHSPDRPLILPDSEELRANEHAFHR